jgi:hypothetical protein
MNLKIKQILPSRFKVYHTSLTYFINHRNSKKQTDLIFGFMGTTFNARYVVHNLQKENMAKSKKTATLTHISQIQGEHLENLEIENDSQNQITLNTLRYNLAILVTAAD